MERTKDFYKQAYDVRMNLLVNKLKSDPDDVDDTAIIKEFKKIATANELAGFYIANKCDNALNAWREDTKNFPLSERDIQVKGILEKLYI